MSEYKQTSNTNEEVFKRFQELLADNVLLGDLYNRNYDEFETDPEKLISCPHEIIFHIKANVLEENEKGETVRSKEICTKNYHIPVPVGKDYNAYMKTFFSFLEECLANSAQKASEENPNE